MRITWTHKYILDICEKKYQVYLEKKAQKKLKQNTDLWRTLSEYIEGSPSTGASYADYWLLYQYIRHRKPKEVLECGTGVTTIVMAHEQPAELTASRLAQWKNLPLDWTEQRQVLGFT